MGRGGKNILYDNHPSLSNDPSFENQQSTQQLVDPKYNTCPVYLRNQRGDALGICRKQLNGSSCAQHGDLKGRLKPRANGKGFEYLESK